MIWRHIIITCINTQVTVPVYYNPRHLKLTVHDVWAVVLCFQQERCRAVTLCGCDVKVMFKWTLVSGVVSIVRAFQQTGRGTVQSTCVSFSRLTVLQPRRMQPRPRVKDTSGNCTCIVLRRASRIEHTHTHTHSIINTPTKKILPDPHN